MDNGKIEMSALTIVQPQALKFLVGAGGGSHTGGATDVDHLDRSAAVPQRQEYKKIGRGVDLAKAALCELLLLVELVPSAENENLYAAST